MTFLRPLTLALILAPLFALRAQPLINDTPKDESIRLSYLYDHDGADDGDVLNGFEIGYASRIYPFDQMVFSYSHASASGYEFNSLLVSFETLFPLNDIVIPYGVFGVGFAWVDNKNAGTSIQEGPIGKIGGGVIVQVTSATSVYAEVNYQIGEKSFWDDGDEGEQDSQNLLLQLGLRFHF